MTFRIRLLLAMLVVVVLTTATSLLLAQRQNQATYNALADQLFSLQTSSFRDLQAVADRTAIDEVTRLATSVRLFAAMEENDPAVYRIAADELRQGEYEFFRLLDREGRMLPPVDGAGGLDDLEAVASEVPAAELARSDGGVQLGFVVLRSGERESPFRILAASISSFGVHVGTLVLGQSVQAPGSRGEGEATLRSVLAADGRLVGGALPASLANELASDMDTGSDRTGVHTTPAGEAWLYRRSLLNPDSLFPRAWLVSALSTAPFVAEQQALAWRIALTGVVASVLAGFFALGFARYLAEPVARLVKATRGIRAGDYGQRLPVTGSREMSQLAESFNDMAAGLELKERYHSVLQQVTDPQVAEGLIAGHVKLGGELRDVTVMFCDIRGYTALTVGRNPEEIIELLNHHMSAMTAVVQAHRGVINQFAGDAIMALFGAPRSYGDDAERAVRCALAMLRERERLNTIVQEPIRVGIGLASGEMVAGCIGAENRNDYTVVGERVNLAARLCSTARSGEVFIDEATHERTRDRFAAEATEPLTLKGFAQPIAAFRVVRPS